MVKLDDPNHNTIITDIVHEMLRNIPRAVKAVATLQGRDTENLVPAESFAELNDCLQRLSQVMRFVASLMGLYPKELTQALGPQDVVHIASYSGKDFPEKSLQDLVTTNPHLQSLCQEVMRTATSSVKLLPERDRLSESLQGMIAGTVDITADRLSTLLEQLPSLRKGLRRIDMKEIDNAAIQLFISQAEGMMDDDQELGSLRSSRFAACLVQGLGIYSDHPGTSDIRDRLQLWLTKNQKRLHLTDLVDLASVCKQSGVAKLEDVQELMAKLQKVKVQDCEGDVDSFRMSSQTLLVASLRGYIVEAIFWFRMGERT